MIMWKKLLGLIVGVVSMTMMPVSCVEQEIVNEDEFKTLCEFVSLAEQINESLKGIKEKSGVKMASLQKRVTDILYGTGVSHVDKMVWKRYRGQDCGEDNRDRPAVAGKALVKDLLCLCEGRDGRSTLKDICYTGNDKRYNSAKWEDSVHHKNTWNELQNKCERGRSEGVPTRTEFQGMRKRLETRIKERKRSGGRGNYIYGGNKDDAPTLCDGQESQTNGICVMYPEGSEEDSTIGIKWLGELKDLVEEVEEMSKSASTHTEPTTKPTTGTKADTNRDTRTKRNPKESSPTERSDEPQKNGNPNTQTATSTETALTTARPPEEQKSSSKIILQFLRIFLFLLSV
ncbi:variant surface glycoprotein (VSG)-related,putative [Trypanosoma brucei gambiense DAL972]|uniref:Variant surface glycoprotein (VSG)-related,putative n=1 Tax=Trypanosoma brucei gambiense (strain MHOM/CI/86/DAL972) TaxID=679716 RepID=C9ZQ05_TRYB9|nr:variant surface glycoprotein (VSG)-related,putative [Trypanosoma brucei gambiense DAL972]CBH11483.1 variant surface glycoprotein (VSG)-related,putative [Trypanosoma brucei gambiense DAL972]|eukprot:XP_011773770.1 variant surface glycoprotein (VSG)-related,putative [Trypanosoma brucei gambiense DAL972]